MLARYAKCAGIDEITDRDPTQNVTRPKSREGEWKRTWLAVLDGVALLNAAVRVAPREHVFVVLPARDRWGSATSGCARSVRVAR